MTYYIKARGDEKSEIAKEQLLQKIQLDLKIDKEHAESMLSTARKGGVLHLPGGLACWGEE